MTGVWPPLRSSMASPYLSIRLQSRSKLFAKGHLWPRGTASFREPCRRSAAGGLELVGLAQGKVILAGSTFRRKRYAWIHVEGRSPPSRDARLRGKQEAAVHR